MRFIQATVKKSFADGLFEGKIIAHIPPNEKAGQPESENYDDDPNNDNQNDNGMFGERFVVQWENGKQSRETPQSILEILVGGNVEGQLEQEKQQKIAYRILLSFFI